MKSAPVHARIGQNMGPGTILPTLQEKRDGDRFATGKETCWVKEQCFGQIITAQRVQVEKRRAASFVDGASPFLFPSKASSFHAKVTAETRDGEDLASRSEEVYGMPEDLTQDAECG
ncbi:uncharacterized protein PV09_03771 [Verruconis gallopava]|uniref:Uncharacterized protein n=1 Tax=Verruconis gallopava TaxID=253628 RepID=A0A0D2B1L2_9PEZI|nr:uncharacterized protein PV09_03771 [Verruconis gallopava]KIW05234.1 hypothetical protein PV09_03771 [Verruconis gallopava]